MSNLSIKDVPEQWAESLRQRAARNHRSLQGELMAIIEAAVCEPGDGAQADKTSPVDFLPGTVRGKVVGFDRSGHPVFRQGWKTVEQIAAELNARFPEPVPGQPLGVDINRAERDAR